jgi:hypothetical protein
LIASEVLTLASGPTVSLAALRLLWAFEFRGCTVKRDDDVLLVGPRGLVTDAEREQIKTHRQELLALVAYCETVQ